MQQYRVAILGYRCRRLPLGPECELARQFSQQSPTADGGRGD